jgi:putative endonuclease
MKSLKRQAAYARGLEAETAAARHLMALGFEIVEQRYKTKSGEVDIIARKDDVVLFVEVKARKTLSDALDSVSHTSQRRIEAAGREWIAAQDDAHMLSWRNDVIAIVPDHPPQHFENVW